MKVLHVGKYFPPFYGGMEFFLADLSQEQVKRGLKVNVIVHNEKISFFFPKKETFKDVSVLKIPSLGRLVYAPISPFFPLYLWRAVRKIKPDLIHLHLPNTSAFWLLLFKGPKIVIHWHADVVPSQIDLRLAYLYRFYRVLERLLLKKALAILVTSPPYLEYSQPLKYFRKKVYIVPLGIDTDRLKKQKVFSGINKLKPYVLSVGRLTYYKGYDYLIDAISYLDGLRLIIVGETSALNKFKITKKNISEKVCFLGKIPSEELNFLYKNCEIFCLSSIERTEAFGLVLLEAMAFAKPLVTTHIPGAAPSWINEHGKTGLVVPMKDIFGLAKAIDYLMKNPDLRIRLGQNAKEKFYQNFTIKKVTDKILAIYKNI